MAVDSNHRTAAVLVLLALLLGPGMQVATAAQPESVPGESAAPPPDRDASSTAQPRKSTQKKQPTVVEGAIQKIEEQPERLKERAEAVWNYRLFADEDAPITVGMVIGALILIVFGLIIARYVSGLLARRVFPRFGLDRSAAATFQTLVFYVLVAMFTVTALQLANIPLTVFALAGGALAIGIGFGSQNIVNNFFSGLILMAERPMKVGDMVEVDGTNGVVEKIGARSTRVRTGDNTHIIVPNSSFLEKNVLNWTLSDELIRATIDVGVVYGSPVETVRELFVRAMSEHERVLASPPPEVLFTDFGNDALIFRGYFWIGITELMDKRRIQSAIRFRIDELFREANLVIAFPQRDVHLDTVSPLEVRVVDESNRG